MEYSIHHSCKKALTNIRHSQLFVLGLSTYGLFHSLLRSVFPAILILASSFLILGNTGGGLFHCPWCLEYMYSILIRVRHGQKTIWTKKNVLSLSRLYRYVRFYLFVPATRPDVMAKSVLRNFYTGNCYMFHTVAAFWLWAVNL